VRPHQARAAGLPTILSSVTPASDVLRSFAFGFTLAVIALALVVRAEDAGDWQPVSEGDGITVSKRTEAGSDVATFRAQAKLRGEVRHLVFALTDDVRSPEWQDTVTEGRVLRTLDGLRSQIVYSRTHQPWPIRDRELVLHRTIEELELGSVYRVRLVCAPNAIPARKGVVRISDCETSFLLRKLDEHTTHVDARVRVDPGGATPGWLANLASRNITRDTLKALQKQAEHTAGKYAAKIALWESTR
jgi:hypothetical protein